MNIHFTILFSLMLAGCQNQTGLQNLDRWIVADYDERFELTKVLGASGTYCRFGCDDICSMNPEPRIHGERALALSDLNAKLTKKAAAAELLLELPLSQRPVIDPMSPNQLAALGPVDERQSKCLDKQQAVLIEAQQMLKELAV